MWHCTPEPYRAFLTKCHCRCPSNFSENDKAFRFSTQLVIVSTYWPLESSCMVLGIYQKYPCTTRVKLETLTQSRRIALLKQDRVRDICSMQQSVKQQRKMMATLFVQHWHVTSLIQFHLICVAPWISAWCPRRWNILCVLYASYPGHTFGVG